MKKFILKFLLFFLHLILLLSGIEAYVSLRANSFNLKARSIKNNKDIEVLILGSSHLQNAVNPEFLDVKSCNLAYGKQDLLLNSELFFNYLKDLRNLKTVIIELDYHTLSSLNDSGYFRLPWYYRYHDIEPYKLSGLDKGFIYPSSPTFFNKYIFRTLLGTNKENVNDYGFVNSSDGLFKKLNYNPELILKNAEKRMAKKHPISNIKNYDFNARILSNMITRGISEGLEVLLISSPSYRTYREYHNPEIMRLRQDFLSSLKFTINEPLQYINMENDSRFTVDNFLNDDHLNPKGAKKFTLILNDLLK